MRRMLWFGTGAALGAGGTLWTRRRVGRLATRLRRRAGVSAALAGAGRHRGEVVGRWRAAVDSGRLAARRREDELWRDLRASGMAP